MSHASGKVRFADGHVMHFEYNGTADIVEPSLYKTFDLLHHHWRNNDWRECTCGEDEAVEIAETYGNGAHWSGRACRYCKAITSDLNREDTWDIEEDGLPEWYDEQSD